MTTQEVEARVHRTAFICSTAHAIILLASVASACTPPTVALDRAVMAYDRTDVDLVSKLLLLNIARAHRDLPLHFTNVSSIAATFDLHFNAGLTPALTGEYGYLLMPQLGVSRGESPTVTITPMQGEEFTRRLLTPFDEQKIGLLLRQGWDVDALLRLVVAEVRVGEGADEVVHYNTPSDKGGYPEFRRLMTHLSSVQDRRALHAQALQFRLSRTIPAGAMTMTDLRLLQDDPSLQFDAAKGLYTTQIPAVGRVVITNYDTGSLTNDALIRLDAEARQQPPSDILVDLREGHPGGELPMRVRLRLRSFVNVLTFLGRGIAAEPEFDVRPDPRTPIVAENPARTMAVLESASPPPEGSGLAVELDGRYYSLAPEKGYPWNKKVFTMLYQLFQMSVAASAANAPVITIAK